MSCVRRLVPALVSIALVTLPALAQSGGSFGPSNRNPSPGENMRLLKDADTPMLPILVNTYFPPNTPTAARCHAVGRKIADTLETLPDDLRVAIMAALRAAGIEFAVNRFGAPPPVPPVAPVA